MYLLHDVCLVENQFIPIVFEELPASIGDLIVVKAVLLATCIVMVGYGD